MTFIHAAVLKTFTPSPLKDLFVVPTLFQILISFMIEKWTSLRSALFHFVEWKIINLEKNKV